MPAPRTPLRRVSLGSLSALARSGSYPDAPVGLGFLEPALSSYADEVETLSSNLAALGQLEKSLEDFNEGFASYMYAMKMNAFVTEWHQVG
jgi:DASH complex subunit DAM1